MSASGGHDCPRAAEICPRVADTVRGEQLSAGGRLSAEYYLSASGGLLSAADFIRGGLFSAADNCPRRTLADINQNFFRRTMADFFLADCPPVDGGSDRIRSDPPRTLADFLSPHKVRLSPPESAKKRSSADTGADSGGQWRTQADPIGSAADSGGQLSASFKPHF